MNVDKWKCEFEMEDIPRLPCIIRFKILDIKENKIKEFNYKLLNKIGACGKLVSKWNKDIKEKCCQCQIEETQIHIIYGCPLTQTIWRKISEEENIPITKRTIIFGVINNRILNNIISSKLLNP